MRGTQGRALETPEQMIERVMNAFARWLVEQAPGTHRNSVVLEVVRTACEFKSLSFGPNPADWPADVTAEVLGEVMPARMIGVEAEFAATFIPAMQLYLDFLVQSGRWQAHNDQARTRAALARLGELPSRFGDRDRQSIAGRVVQLAVDEGIDLDDPDAVADFMQRFNDMPLEWRQRATDGPSGGSLTDDDRRTFRDGPAEESVDPVRPIHADGIAAALDILVPLIDVRPGHGASVSVPPAEAEWAALAGTLLVARVLELVEWVDQGRAVTSTGAMRRPDLRMWCKRWRLPAGAAGARSMWDVPAIALPWRIGIDCGVIGLTGSRARRGQLPIDAPVAERVQLGRSIVQRHLDFVLVPTHIEGELLNAVNFVMLPLLLSMCVSPGQDLSGFEAAIAAYEPRNAETLYPRLVAGYVTADIAELVVWGEVTISGTRATIPAGLRPAVVQAINSPFAPFRVTVEPGGVPVPDPDFDAQ